MKKWLLSLILVILCLSPVLVFGEVISFSNLSGKKNVSISYSKPYSLIQETFSTSAQKSILFLVPSNTSLNITLNTSLSDNNEVILNLTNLRTSDSLSSKITSNTTFWYISSDNLSFGQYLLKITPANFSSNRNLSLYVYLHPQFSYLNFSNIKQNLYNKNLQNQTAHNISFYVDNTSENKIEIYLKVNQSTSDIELILYSPSGTIINQTTTTSGEATIAYNNQSNFPSGYWKLKINNTNQSTSYTYNLTISLFGTNISSLGNISSEVNTVETNFSWVFPEKEILPTEYYSKISIKNSTEVFSEVIRNTTKFAPTLYIESGDYVYVKSQTLYAGEENFSSSMDLYLNLNQTKNITLSICNRGNKNLTSLSEKNSTVFKKNNLYLNFSVILPSTPIPPNNCKNLTISIIKAPENQSYLGNFSGWILLNTSNALPYTDINITLNITVVNETSPELRLGNCTNNCYLNLGEQAQFALYPYYYDRKNLINLTNSSLNLTILGPINKTIILKKQTSLLYNNSTVSFNKTGSYLAKSISISKDGNKGSTSNLSFSVVNTLYFNVTTQNPIFDPNSEGLIKFKPLFKDLSEDPFNLTLSQGKITLTSLATENAKELSGNLVRIGNTNLWNLSFSVPKNFVGGKFTLKATVSDKHSNTGNLQTTIRVNNSYLIASSSGISSKLYLNETDKYKLTIWNYGLKQAKVNVSLHVCDKSYLDIIDDPGTTANIPVNPNSSITLNWTVKARKLKEDCEVYFTISGGAWWYNSSSYTTTKKYVDIVKSSSSSSSSSSSFTTQTDYKLYFTEPISNVIEIVQGLNKSISVEISNLGNNDVHDLYLKIEGLNSSWYSISPSTKTKLEAGKKKSFSIKFSIPTEATPKKYEFTLKAVSEEKTISKTFYLVVLKRPGIAIEGLPSEVSIVQGQKKSFKITIKNLGNVSLHNLSISLTGIKYTISPKGKLTLDGGEKGGYNITISTNDNEEIGTRIISVKVKGDENEITTSFKLTVLPSEETKKKIENQYKELLLEYNELYSKFTSLPLSKDDETYKNLTKLFSQANDSLQKVKDSLNKKDYISARNYLSSLQTSLDKIKESLSYIEKSGIKAWSILPYLLLFMAVGIAILLAYLYYTSTKPGYRIGKGYVFRREENLLDKLREWLNKVAKKIRK